ncbi:hypothetical protein [Kitasatospora sp. NPDC051914]|uniref:hypothetical protein n=1 Tax=Kitasatospora sp. NPDC051914 TaxID=3154945 RepID=UPI0034352463
MSKKARGAPGRFALWREVLAAYAMPAVTAGLGGAVTRQPHLVAAALTTIGGTSALVTAALGTALRRRPVLTRPELAGGTYPLTGGRAYSYPELTTLLGGLLGRPIRYLDPGPSELHAHLVGRAGMPGWLATHVVEIQQLAVVRRETPDDTFRRLAGRAPRTLEAFLGENLHRFR